MNIIKIVEKKIPQKGGGGKNLMENSITFNAFSKKAISLGLGGPWTRHDTLQTINKNFKNQVLSKA